jgi:hypothetical protein
MQSPAFRPAVLRLILALIIIICTTPADARKAPPSWPQSKQSDATAPIPKPSPPPPSWPASAVSSFDSLASHEKCRPAPAISRASDEVFQSGSAFRGGMGCHTEAGFCDSNFASFETVIVFVLQLKRSSIMRRPFWLQRSSFRPTTNHAGATSTAAPPCII